MKGAGFYNSFSHLQRTSIEKSLPIIRNSVKKLIQKERFINDKIIGIADYGCSQVMYYWKHCIMLSDINKGSKLSIHCRDYSR